MGNAPIRWKALHNMATKPERKTPGSAGYDLHVVDSLYLEPGECKRAQTGLAVALPEGTVGFIKPRSSAFFRGLDLDGTIDSDYRGEILLQVRNATTYPISIEAGERVAQLVVLPVHLGESVQVESLDDTARGTGGFGSTGQ